MKIKQEALPKWKIDFLLYGKELDFDNLPEDVDGLEALRFYFNRKGVTRDYWIAHKKQILRRWNKKKGDPFGVKFD